MKHRIERYPGIEILLERPTWRKDVRQGAEVIGQNKDWKTGYNSASGAEILQAMSSKIWDHDRYIYSASGKAMAEHFENVLPYADETCPEVLAYWSARGIRKTIHDAGKPLERWASYVPVSADLPENKIKKYPLIIALRGGGNDIFMIETQGYAHLAAEEELITIIPMRDDDEYLARLYDDAIRNFPVDRSRVYVTGYSSGGWRAQAVAITMADRFAAACCGAVIGWEKYHEASEKIDFAKEKKMPIVFITGTAESRMGIPYYKTCWQDCYQPFAILKETKVYGSMLWREINDCEYFSYDQHFALGNTTGNTIEKIIGTRFDKTYIREYHDCDYYFGEVHSRDGVCRLLHVGIENQVHWPSPAHARVSWEFMKNFTLDELGNSIYTPIAKNK